jgi:glutathione-independent formaldehyde dehydrogenase
MNKLAPSASVFVPKDPKAEDKLMKEGKIAFDFGEFFE